METRSIHFKSDFLVRLMNEVDWSTPFSIRFFTTRAVSAKVVAYDGENYVGCELDESTGALLVPFERFTEIYRQGLGTLRMELTYRLSNSLYPDQYQDVVLPAQPVVCTNDQDEQFYLSLALTGDDDVEVSASVVAPFMVGPQGTAGTGISTMVQTSASMASAGANVWKMTLTDGREFSFTVLNGEKGDTGAQGPQGPQGPQGAKGDKGDKGDTGARGPQGEQGPRGVPGQRGEKGAKGDKGDRGLTGESGPAGSTPLIGQNGNWWVGGTDTGVKADYSGTEAQRQETFEANEANRQEEFDSKEATRDAANEAALNCADTLAALGPKMGSIETAGCSSEIEIEFDTDNDEYIGHIDNDGIHAKEVYLQSSRNGNAKPLSTLENTIQNISDAVSNISKEEEESLDGCIVIGESENNTTVEVFDKKVVFYGDLLVYDQQTTETSKIDTDKRINAAIIRDYVASLDLSNYPINGNVGILGDSTIAGYGGTRVKNLLTIDGIVTDISTSGDTISGQTTKWNNIDPSVKAAMNYVFVQIGLNDSSESRVDITTFSQYQTLISSIRADAPSAKIILGTMIPCRERYYVTSNYNKSIAEIKYHNWKELNRAIKDMLFIGANSCASYHTIAMGDYNDNLLLEYESTLNDHIHPNAAGTKLIAWSWLTKLYNN